MKQTTSLTKGMDHTLEVAKPVEFKEISKSISHYITIEENNERDVSIVVEDEVANLPHPKPFLRSI